MADFSSLATHLQLDILNKAKIKFFDHPVTYGTFFKTNDLYRYGLNLDKSPHRVCNYINW